MNHTVSTLRLDMAEVERYLGTYLGAFQPRSPSTLRLHDGTVRRFLRFLREHEPDGDQVALTEKRLVKWLVEQASCTTVAAAQRYQALSRFLGALAKAGLIDANPMRQFEAQFGKQRWVPIARALKSNGPKKALEAMRVVPPLSGPLGRHIREYLALKRSVGLKYDGVEATLASLDAFLRSRGVASVAAVGGQMIRYWESGMACTPLVRRARTQSVKAFFEHLVGLGIVRRNPCALSELPRRASASTFHPYIYSQQEIAALLAASRSLPPNHLFRLRSETCCTLIALLYALGLRLGEARRLQIGDVDLEQGLLFLRETKFHKSRTVPFGPRLGQCLQTYLGARRTMFTPVRNDDPLFVAYRPTPVSEGMVNSVFHKLLATTGIGQSNGRRPRPHDLRHSFAVHRLLRWYREGVDVQSKLPLLSTFMGHVEVSSTQVYLTITADLLNEASGRFYRHFGDLADAEGQP